MTYLVLVTLFFLSGLVAFFGIFGFIFRPLWWKRNIAKIKNALICWFSAYSIFILFFTGPTAQRPLSSSEGSSYKLPWTTGVSRFVSQGNRSFTSHRDLHLFAWDFWMPIGTKILAARGGTVVKVEQSFDGVGFYSNYVTIQHNDGSRAMYAHIRKNGSVVKIDQHIEQGQHIAYSGMVGQTINPHVHFVVLNEDETASLPITFADVPSGVPLAGRFYTSGNSGATMKAIKIEIPVGAGKHEEDTFNSYINKGTEILRQFALKNDLSNFMSAPLIEKAVQFENKEHFDDELRKRSNLPPDAKIPS